MEEVFVSLVVIEVVRQAPKSSLGAALNPQEESIESPSPAQKFTNPVDSCQLPILHTPREKSRKHEQTEPQALGSRVK